MPDTRIRMTRTKELVLNEQGSPMRFRAGEFYLVDEEVADQLIEQHYAHKEDEPPTCDICGHWFEGINAWAAIERHRGTDHEEALLAWDPESGEDPPPLDGTHPEVQELREQTVADLKFECNRIGVADSEVVATGASGKVKDDWIRHLLRAKGRRGFYASPETEEES